jgi:hypothetical protein
VKLSDSVRTTDLPSLLRTAWSRRCCGPLRRPPPLHSTGIPPGPYWVRNIRAATEQPEARGGTHMPLRGPTRRDGAAVGPLGAQWLRGSDQARGADFAKVRFRGHRTASQFRSMRSPASSIAARQVLFQRGGTFLDQTSSGCHPRLSAWRSIASCSGSGMSSQTSLRTGATGGNLGSPRQHTRDVENLTAASTHIHQTMHAG